MELETGSLQVERARAAAVKAVAMAAAMAVAAKVAATVEGAEVG